jgi:hypothetical protein
MKQRIVIFTLTLVFFFTSLGLLTQAKNKYPIFPAQGIQHYSTPLQQAGSFTPTITYSLYLPVVLNPPPPTPPNISNIHVAAINLNACQVSNGGIGSLFTITLDYTDINGDIDHQAIVFGSATFKPDNVTFSVSYTNLEIVGNAITFEQCIRFANQSEVEFNLQLRDNAGLESNPLPLPISKPTGAS